MLEEMSWEEFREWQLFYQLEPSLLDRIGTLFASVVQALWNIHRDTVQHPSPFSLARFRLLFGDDEPPPAEAPRQTLEYQEQLIDAWCFSNNAIIEARSKGVR